MKAPLTLLWGLLLASAGCGVRNAAEMMNPLATGVLQNNASQHRRSWDEAINGLPSRSLVSEASLVSLDRRTACFDVHLRYLSEPGSERHGDAYVDVRRLVARLEIDDPEDLLLEDAHPSGDVALAHDRLVGTRTVVQTRNRETCWDTRHGRRCQTVSESYAEPVETIFIANDGAGQLCFDHRGAITEETQLLVLELAHPAEGRKAAHRFAWRFPS